MRLCRGDSGALSSSTEVASPYCGQLNGHSGWPGWALSTKAHQVQRWRGSARLDDGYEVAVYTATAALPTDYRALSGPGWGIRDAAHLCVKL